MAGIDASDIWKLPEITMGPATKTPKDKTMPPISLTLIPVNPSKDSHMPLKTINLDQTNWKEDLEQYNALDKIKDFTEKVAFDLPKRSRDKYNFDFTLIKAHANNKSVAFDNSTDSKENSLKKLIESYSRINEFMNGCDWTESKVEKKDPKEVEEKYLYAKNEFMSQNLMLMPKDKPKSVLKDVIDLSEDDNNILSDIISKRNKGVHTYNVGKDGALSISVHPLGSAKELSYDLVRVLGLKCTKH